MLISFASYTVNPASTDWTPGPTGITVSQSLFIRATGYARWSSLPKFSLVEGGYGADGFPATHSLDPADAGGPNPANSVTNVPSLSMAILAVPSGEVPGPLTPGAGRGDALEPRWSLSYDSVTRVTVFYSSDMANKTRTDGPWDIYFGYVDGLYDDSSGSFSVTAAVSEIEEQPAEEVLGLPGHETEDDIDDAEFCSYSGLLTPGNRLVVVDGRLVADEFAPYLESGPWEA